MRIFKYLLPFIIFSTAMAENTVRMIDPKEPGAYMRLTDGSTVRKLQIDGLSSGEGTSSGSPFTVYLPMDNGSNNQNDKYYEVGMSMLPVHDNSSAGIGFELELSGDDDLDVHFALQSDDDEDKYIVLNDNVVSNSSTLGGNYYFIPIGDDGVTDSLCIDETKLDCSQFDGATSTSSNDEVLVYIFLADSTTVFDDPIDPSDQPGGIFVKVKVSNDIGGYGSQTLVTKVVVDRGDASAYVDYSGQILQNEADFTRVAIYSSGTFHSEYKKETNKTDGEVLVTKLTNGTTYTLGATYLDRYGFVTSRPPTKTGNVTPQELEAFLEESSCYFVTAGFKRDHYVLRYMRSFRDDILLKFSLGQSFVKFYYSTAPKYVKYILQNSWLAKLIRVFSYLLYFMLKYYLWLPVMSLLGILFFKKIRLRYAQKNFSC